MMASNLTLPVPYEESLKLLPPLLPWISDFHLSLLCPVLAYWFVSGIYFIIDYHDLFPQ